LGTTAKKFEAQYFYQYTSDFARMQSNEQKIEGLPDTP
jgi:hypothetical protein